jgi:hypothetical protein
MAHLIYVNGRGNGERIRFILGAALGSDWKETYLTNKAELREVKDQLPFDFVPMLEIDGMKLNQSHASMRYVAKKYNLIPNDPELAVKADVMHENLRDVENAFVLIGWGKIKMYFNKQLL